MHGHVVTAVRVLRHRQCDPWTLGSLAEEVHLSRSQLLRAFDATLGRSPMAYLRQLRAQEMARLFDCTDLSIAEAARSVGWSDPNYASRCFRADHRVSPTELRRRQVGSEGPAGGASGSHEMRGTTGAERRLERMRRGELLVVPAAGSIRTPVALSRVLAVNVSRAVGCRFPA